MRTKDYKKRLFEKSNIFLALFSVHSYIANEELLTKEDREAYDELRDIFDEDNINRWVSLVYDRLHELIYEDKYLEAKVYFKPKKYDNGPVFRPLHHASLLDQITAVAMLNLLIYDFDNHGKVGMSDLSRLIPHNFYGNRVAYDIEHLFTPWKTQYKKYNKLANDLYKKYHDNLEYKWEVDLDLENFFPSVNPVVLFKYVEAKLPVNLSKEDKKILLKILEKLIFVEIEELDEEDLNRYRGNDFDFECRFAQGIPQGMPQSYFLANLLMIEIEEKYRKVFPNSEMLFYVDDSMIFTNDIKDEKDFALKIDELNKLISHWTEEEFKAKSNNLSKALFDYVKNREGSYGISIHAPGDKSTASNISNSRQSEIYLNCIGRETSKTAFELNTNFSDEESTVLLHKTQKLYDAVQRELDSVKAQIEDTKGDSEKTDLEAEAYKKKLIRYKKFFKYRCNDLAIRAGEAGNEVIKEFLSDLKKIIEEEDLKFFFELFSEDIFSALLSLILSELCNSDMEVENVPGIRNIKDVCLLLDKLNTLLFSKDNKKTSYLYQSFSRYYDIDYAGARINRTYFSLKNKVGQQTLFYKKKKDDYRRESLEKELKLVSMNNILKLRMSKDYVEMVKLVDDNSSVIRRMLLNAYISGILGFEISDDYLLHKTINRKITYTELRILAMLRSKKFDDKTFFNLIDSFLDEEYNCAIDYSIFQVLGYYKTYVSEIDRIDNLILVHKYTCDIWKNGSKHLYFYTLHNQEHAVDLVQNSVKLVRAIDYIDLKEYDYYILFIACYLHDISMVTFPFLDAIQEDAFRSNEIYTDFITDVKKSWEEDSWSDKSVKKILRDYYLRVDEFYESLVRSNHAKDSATEIRNRRELSFIDSALREIVAEVSEAHGYDIADIYSKKSNARNQNWSEKYTKILLRMADLLDMSNYRVSRVILNHNINNMGAISRFHWLSHMITRGYKLDVKYDFNDDVTADFLQKSSIIETITLTVVVDLQQMTKVGSPNCKKMNLKGIEDNKILLECGKECKNTECNFLCKWFSQKNYYLFLELDALKKYLNDVSDNYFETRIEVVIEPTDKSILSPEQFTYLANYVDGE